MATQIKLVKNTNEGRGVYLMHYIDIKLPGAKKHQQARIESFMREEDANLVIDAHVADKNTTTRDIENDICKVLTNGKYTIDQMKAGIEMTHKVENSKTFVLNSYPYNAFGTN